ncbi:MAG: transposase [Candidatus Acidiferrales bacterium]
MARKPRLEFVGALYHVFNRGHARSELFASPQAAGAFVDCLFQACQRMQWRLHAFGLLPDQYHLAIETPRGNLVSGVHWLQSVFGNRFNRARGESARAFRGRYQAVLVEPGPRWTEVVDCIHLGAVQAGLVDLPHLAGFRWSSFRSYVRGARERPPFFSCDAWLRPMGLEDDPNGWKRYGEHLEALRVDEARLRELSAAATRGWAYGSPEFRRGLAERMQGRRFGSDGELAEENRRDWHRRLGHGLRSLQRELAEAASAPKSAPWKIALAAWLKAHTSVLNRWLSEQLHMGPPDAVSRYVGELHSGKRPAAAEAFLRLPPAGPLGTGTPAPGAIAGEDGPGAGRPNPREAAQRESPGETPGSAPQ